MTGNSKEVRRKHPRIGHLAFGAVAMFATWLTPMSCAALRMLVGDVVRVIDGDTLLLREEASAPIRIRLWGINAPERHEAGGIQAAIALESLLARDGSMLFCGYRHMDKYDRTVAQCYTAQGTDLGGFLVTSGAARDCPRFSRGYYAEFEKTAQAGLPAAAFCRPE